jgi:sulfatase modifying factor 1
VAVAASCGSRTGLSDPVVVGRLATGSCEPGGPGVSNCGPEMESCCLSLPVPGGTYSRTYTNVSGPIAEGDPATISALKLDKYEVTVGRFRRFARAWKQGWLPAPGAGKHTHVDAGQGLASSEDPALHELGWLASDNDNVAPTDANLACDAIYSTWTSEAGAGENLPATCVNWYEAYAFCIWDGGFLPSEAETEYAEAGGSQQRKFPWGSMDPGTTNSYALYGCYYPNGVGICAGLANIGPVGTASQGSGAWGQVDLAGSVWEWDLDSYDAYVVPCSDCATLEAGSSRVIRGGNFSSDTSSLLPPNRSSFPPTDRSSALGIRCAREP